MDQERFDYADRDLPTVSLAGLALKWAGPVLIVVFGVAAVWLGYWLDAHP